MNAKFQSWFSQGKAVEALCGVDGFFIPDVTYREKHDFILAVGELLEWSCKGNIETAAKAFDSATIMLLGLNRFEDSLLLLRSYIVLRGEMQTSLPLDENLLASRLGQAVRNAAEKLSQDERLRSLLLSVSQNFPAFRKAIALKDNEI